MSKIEIKNSSTNYVYVYSNGCVPNRLEGKKIKDFFQNLGWEISNDYRNCRLIVFNSCGFSGNKIDESINILNKFKKEKHHTTEMILTGCLRKIKTDLKTHFRGRIIDITEFNKIFGSNQELNNLYVSDNVIDDLEITKKDVFHIITSTGCLGKCSYCTIKKARGSIKSKPKDDILKEFKKAVELKYRKFILWGDDLGAYGRDISTNIVKLINSLIDYMPSELDFSLFLHRLNPQWLILHLKEFRKILKTGKIKLLYSPIQSGSNRILKLMRRQYSINEVKKAFNILQETYPSLIIKTDIMVGFPSETEKDFDATLKLVEDVVFGDIAVFKYYGVPNTPAFYMKGQITEEIKDKRVKLLWRKLQHLRYTIDIENGICWLIDREKGIKKGPMCSNCYKTKNKIERLMILKGLSDKKFYCENCSWSKEIS